MNHSFSSRATVAPDVVFRLTGNEAVLLNLKTNGNLSLDPVGIEMWVVLTNTCSIEAAYNSLLQEFEVDSLRLRKDLNDFVEKLLNQGLVELSIPDLKCQGSLQ
jgi:hypothetical protein